jgi:hypothetical protein
MTQDYLISRPGAGDLAFQGELIIDYSARSSGRVRIFRTSGGRIVAEQHRAALRGTRPRYVVGIVDDESELATVLDDSDGAREVMRRIGQDDVERL